LFQTGAGGIPEKSLLLTDLAQLSGPAESESTVTADPNVVAARANAPMHNDVEAIKTSFEELDRL
jgi:hypothetical protein